MPGDGDIDASRYIDYDLLEAADYIDVNRFPENNRRLNAEIDRRGIRDKNIPSPQVAQDARDTASSRNSASVFDRLLNYVLAVVLLTFGVRGLFSDDLLLVKYRGTGSELLHLHGMPAVLSGAQMIAGGGLLVASLLVYAFDGHRYTPLYVWFARLGRYAGLPLVLGGLVIRIL
jgi:hypothetical protein